jgi:glucose-1-phosphate thymidylyltransferase
MTAHARMKGIVLAGGTGSRLYPATLAVNKQLLPIYDKPMIYYPLSILMLAGIRDILIITTPTDREAYRTLLGHGKRWGISIQYGSQPTPGGIAQALTIGRDFVGRDAVTLILGDNVFYGAGLEARVRQAIDRPDGATIFAYWVNDPQRYGVVTFDENRAPVDIIEKPERTESNWAVTGLYVYDNSVLDIAAGLTPSARGELEITDVNRHYLEAGRLTVERLGRGFAWLDTGTHDSLLEASEFVRAIQHRTGVHIASLEEVAWRRGFIGAEDLARAARRFHKTAYGTYLRRILHQDGV